MLMYHAWCTLMSVGLWFPLHTKFCFLPTSECLLRNTKVDDLLVCIIQMATAQQNPALEDMQRTIGPRVYTWEELTYQGVRSLEHLVRFSRFTMFLRIYPRSSRRPGPEIFIELFRFLPPFSLTDAADLSHAPPRLILQREHFTTILRIEWARPHAQVRISLSPGSPISLVILAPERIVIAPYEYSVISEALGQPDPAFDLVSFRHTKDIPFLSQLPDSFVHASLPIPPTRDRDYESRWLHEAILNIPRRYRHLYP